MPRWLHDLPLTAGLAAIGPIARLASERGTGTLRYARGEQQRCIRAIPREKTAPPC
jgi:hypothetical protein